MRKAGDVISALFKDRFGDNFMETARSNAELFTSWEEIVSEVWPHGADHKKGDIPAAAVHSQIRELVRGVLLVEADHPGWVQILQTRQAGLLKAVQRRFAELNIKGIAFMLSRGPLSSSDDFAPEKSTVTFEPLPEKRQDPEKQDDCVLPRDEELYAALKSLEESVKERFSKERFSNDVPLQKLPSVPP